MSDTMIQELLHKVANISGPLTGAHSLRVNGKSMGMESSPAVSIIPRKGGDGFELRVKPGTRGETVYIPVIIDGSGYKDVVTNDFYIGENCSDILIVAGCAIHNEGGGHSQHDGIHSFHIGENSNVTYKEAHYGCGSTSADAGRILNPVTHVHLAKGANFEMESVQIGGVDSTYRLTTGTLADESLLTVTEKLMTHGTQTAKTEFELDIDGSQAKARVISRSVAKENSYQEFVSRINGNNACVGRSECDAIIMGNAVVKAIPEITATHIDASLVHEAAIGRIAGEQLTKLMTLGLTEEEAEAQIINGFLK